MTRLPDDGKSNIKTLPYYARLGMAEESNPDNCFQAVTVQQWRLTFVEKRDVKATHLALTAQSEVRLRLAEVSVQHLWDVKPSLVGVGVS